MTAAGKRPLWRTLASTPEIATAVLTIVAFFVAANQSRFFLDRAYLLDTTSLYVEAGLMALAMTLIIVSGNIDLSVGGMLALVAVTVGLIQSKGVSGPVVVAAGLAGGALLGLVNGLLVAKAKLPSFVVTLAGIAIYRGLAQAILGSKSVPIQADLVGVDRVLVFGFVPLPLLLLVALAGVFALVLHRRVFGRLVYAVGTNEQATHYSGVDIDRVKIIVFTLSGLMAGLGALLMDSRLGVARYDHASGIELDVITAVVLGGTSISGGRGTVGGTCLALLLLVILKTGMGVANVKPEYQLAIVGVLLIVSIVFSNLTARLR